MLARRSVDDLETTDAAPPQVHFLADDDRVARAAATTSCEVWRAVCGGLDADDRDRLRRRSRLWRCGIITVIDVDPCALRADGPRALRADGALRRFQADPGDAWLLRVADAPVPDGRAGAPSGGMPPGELYVSRLTTAASLHVPDCRCTLIHLPAGAHGRLQRPLARLADGWLDSPGARLLADMALSLPQRLAAADDAERDRLGRRLADVIATCLTQDRPPATRGARRAERRGPRERVMTVISDNLGSALLDVNRICRLAGVSRTALYRIFADDRGVAHRVREMRLQRVMDALSDPDLADVPVATIAERCGLHNASSFSRSFRRTFGLSPSAARARALRGATDGRSAGGSR